jgi:hypothetical protein
MPDQQDMPAHVREHLEQNMIQQEICGFRIGEKLGAGNTAITDQVEDQNGFSWALKLVTAESYGDRAPYSEIARFAGVRDDRFLVFPKEIGEWTLTLGEETFRFIWFKSRRVNGQTLKGYLKSGVPFNARTEVEKFIEHATVALEELSRIGYAHGDAHDGNLMREVIGETGTLPEVRYVVIDFSESHRVEETQGGLQKDMECFGRHLQAFADSISRRRTLSRDDEKILSAIEHIPGLLRGITADGIGIRKPSDVLERFRDNLRSAEEAPRKLRTPFDALSAEDIKNDALLIDLCFTNSWWAAELEKPGNVLLVGPRGCGKTMLFRRLRLRTKISAEKSDEISTDQFVGFYLPCESLFFNRISDLTDSLVEKNRNALIIFFNMAVMHEVATTLAYLPNEVGGPVSGYATEQLRRLVKEETGAIWKELNLPGAGVSLFELAECAERVMRHIRESIASGNKIQALGSTEFVTRLVSTVKQHIPQLSARLFIFFLDDYTEERVPLTLQKMLHPIVCQRSGEMCFKISAHMFGSMYSFPQPLALDEGRNINIINLGSEYLNPKKKKTEKKALIQIMNKRLEECEGYRGTIQKWLGESSYPGNKSLNRALHDKGTRAQTKYHGIKCLVDLCTGDISEMIRMVGEIFRRAGVASETEVQTIDPSIQDRAIRNISRDFLSRIRNIRPDGQDLFDVVDSFGKLSQQVLYERPLVGQGQDSAGQPRKDPYDLLTIYVDDLTKALPFARKVWERLQRASIFVDIRLAPSQRTVIADRVTLRRIYCPAFATTLTSSEHLQLSKDQFERFIQEPAEFSKDWFRRNVKEIRGKTLWDPDETEDTTIQPDEPESPITLPDDNDQRDFSKDAPPKYKAIIEGLPTPQKLRDVVKLNSSYDLFIGALGFEERTTKAIEGLVKNKTRVNRALLLEFDLFHQATESRREQYEQLISSLTGGAVYRPINAPVASLDPTLPERLRDALLAASKGEYVKILFDCTSCPSRILSKCLRVLLDFPCDLTVLYSEARKYYPTKEEWDSGIIKPGVTRIEGPFSGVRFVEKPADLQADDISESPVLLVLFHTFNTERTSGVLAEIDPAQRIWVIGEPHDLATNSYRIDMAKAFAAPTIYPGDKWALVTTFDYRGSMEALAGIYKKKHANYRIAIMPHGSKMQTLGANLFAVAHQVSMVFAMPKDYNPARYSDGCRQTWAIPFGDTSALKEVLATDRVLG